MALGQQRRSDDIRRGMSSSPLGNRCDQTTSSVACHHLSCAAHTVEQCRAGLPIIVLENTQSDEVGIACYHHPWIEHTIGPRRVCHVYMAHGQHTWSDEAGCGILLSPLCITHIRTTSGVTCNHSPLEAHSYGRRWAWISIISLIRHTRSKDVRRGMPSLPLDSRYSRTTSDVACHHCPWLAHTIGSRRALDAIITLVQQTRSNYVGRGMPLSIMVFSSY